MDTEPAKLLARANEGDIEAYLELGRELVERLKDRRAKVEAELLELGRRIEMLEGKSPTLPRPVLLRPTPKADPAPGRRPTMGQMALDIIREFGRPMSTGEIYREAKKRGWATEGGIGQAVLQHVRDGKLVRFRIGKRLSTYDLPGQQTEPWPWTGLGPSNGTYAALLVFKEQPDAKLTSNEIATAARRISRRFTKGAVRAGIYRWVANGALETEGSGKATRYFLSEKARQQ